MNPIAQIPDLSAWEEKAQLFIKSHHDNELHGSYDACAMGLMNILEGEEDQIDGEEYVNRMDKIKLFTFLGLKHAQWLYRNQFQFPALMGLMDKEHNKGITFIDFPGTIGKDVRNKLVIPVLLRVQRQWTLTWRGLEGGYDSHVRVAVRL